MIHFIKELSKEHKSRLIKMGTHDAFISKPVIGKAIFDLMQDLHPKTLVCTLLLETSGKDTSRKFFERVHQIMVLCEDRTPLHLKIQA